MARGSDFRGARFTTDCKRMLKKLVTVGCRHVAYVNRQN